VKSPTLLSKHYPRGNILSSPKRQTTLACRATIAYIDSRTSSHEKKLKIFQVFG